MCSSDLGPSVQLSNFAADGLELTIYFWIGDPENGQGGPRSEVNLAILRLFNERGGLEKGVGISVSIPLGWSHRRAAAGKASAEAIAAMFDADVARREILATADADLADVQTRFAAWVSMQQSAISMDAATARTVRGHEMGAIDLADVLYARRQANDARRAEISARADALRAVVKLLIDSHTIWSDAHDEQPAAETNGGTDGRQ